MEGQKRVVVIQDASREVCLSAIKWILQGFSLKSSDKLTVASILHQVINPMGYKSRIDSSMVGASPKIVEDEVARKKKEYQDNTELTQISKLYEEQKVEFEIEVDAGPSAKVAGLEAAIRLGATWVILDRQMKKDKKLFLEKLTCGISKINHDSSIVQVRGPKLIKMNSLNLKETRRISKRISYDEMLPGSLEDEEEEDDDDLFSIELFPKMSTSSMGSTESSTSSFSDGKLTQGLKEKTEMIIKETSLKNQDQYPTNDIGKKDSVCSICMKEREIESERISFSYEELSDATNEFSPENLIYEGGYSSTFKGELKDKKLIIAVKKQKDMKKFKSEVETLEKTRDTNVVALLGSCSNESQRVLLVYEYICNGSLDNHLSNQISKLLTWGQRLKIALGVAKGLNYLHQNKIIHRDIRPNNILVTHDYEPVLSGFGLARTQNESEWLLDEYVTGAFGYLAPEYAESGKASTKTDVYSFGVVLLELITSQSTRGKRLEDKSLMGWAKPLLKESKYSELIDPKIISPRDSYQFISMVQVAQKCLTKDPHKRLSMIEVVSTLEQIMDDKSWCELDDILLNKLNGLRNADGEIERKSTSSQVQSINTAKIPYLAIGNVASASSTTELRRKSNSTSPGQPQSFKRTRSKSILSYGESLN